MKCDNCPLKQFNTDYKCDGERHNRYCELTNPYHINYKYGYIPIILNKKGFDMRISVGFLSNQYNELINNIIDVLDVDEFYFNGLSNRLEEISQKCSLICVHSNEEDHNFIKKNNINRFILLYDGLQKNLKNIRDYQGIITVDKKYIKDFPEDMQGKIFIFDKKEINNYLYNIMESPKNQFTKMPNLLAKIHNFVKAEIKHIINSKLLEVPDQIKQERLQKCYNCVYLTSDKSCSLCGCPVVEKTKMPSEKCPHGFWVEYNITQTNSGGCGCNK